MSVSNLELKGALFNLLWNIHNQSTLVRIQNAIVEITQQTEETETDWWDELSPSQQKSLDEAIKDSKNKDNLISHQEVMKLIKNNIKRLENG